MKNSKKQYRHRYFSIEIETGLKGSQISRLFDSPFSLVEGLQKIQFVTQKGLETILPELLIQDQNPKIVLLDFIGQLEQKPGETLPYWKISCQTSMPTTAISVARALSQHLFSTMDSTEERSTHSLDSRIKVRSREDLEDLQPDWQVLLPDSDWSPGYLNHKLSSLLDFMENAPIKEEVLLKTIQDRPKTWILFSHLGETMRVKKEKTENKWKVA